MGENYTIISLLRENFWHLNPNIVIVKRTAYSAQRKQAHNHNKWNRNEADDGEKDRSIYNTIVWTIVYVRKILFVCEIIKVPLNIKFGK